MQKIFYYPLLGIVLVMRKVAVLEPEREKTHIFFTFVIGLIL